MTQIVVTHKKSGLLYPLPLSTYRTIHSQSPFEHPLIGNKLKRFEEKNLGPN